MRGGTPGIYQPKLIATNHCPEDGRFTRGNQEAEPLEMVDSYRTLLLSISQSPHHCVSQTVPTVNVKLLNSMTSLSVHPS